MTRDDIAPLLGILFLFGLFACVVIGKQEHEDETDRYDPVKRDVVAEYAAQPEQRVTGLTEREQTMLAALAKHMGRKYHEFRSLNHPRF